MAQQRYYNTQNGRFECYRFGFTLESHYSAWLINTVQVFACGRDRLDPKWSPAEPKTLLVQTDWEWPNLAIMLGARDITCCGYTDGTVDCPEHGTTARAMILAAGNWLDEHDGDTFRVPLGSEIYGLLEEAIER